MVVTETKLKMDEHHIASGHQGVILEEHLNDVSTPGHSSATCQIVKQLNLLINSPVVQKVNDRFQIL